MSRALIVLIVLISSNFASGQQLSGAGNSRAAGIGVESFAPKLFEPYQADYQFRGKVIGIPLSLFRYSTRITELRDEWQETQVFHIELLDTFGLADPNLRDVEISSVVDLKTGLLKKMSARFPNRPIGLSEFDFTTPGKIDVRETNGKRTSNRVIDSHGAVYPCTYSNTFLSYLPLNDTFSQTFNCVEIDKDDNSNKDVVRFSNRTLRVVGSETVVIDAGKFDCYKLVDRSEEIKYNKDGSVKSKKSIQAGAFNPERLIGHAYNFLWVDKATRKVVKAEFAVKGASLSVELQPSTKRDL